MEFISGETVGGVDGSQTLVAIESIERADYYLEQGRGDEKRPVLNLTLAGGKVTQFRSADAMRNWALLQNRIVKT